MFHEDVYRLPRPPRLSTAQGPVSRDGNASLRGWIMSLVQPLRRTSLFQRVPTASAPFLQVGVVDPITSVLRGAREGVTVDRRGVPTENYHQRDSDLFPRVDSYLFVARHLNYGGVLPRGGNARNRNVNKGRVFSFRLTGQGTYLRRPRVLFRNDRFNCTLLEGHICFDAFYQRSMLSNALVVRPFSNHYRIFLKSEQEENSPAFLAFFSNKFSFQGQVVVNVAILPYHFQFTRCKRRGTFALHLVQRGIVCKDQFTTRRVSYSVPLFPGVCHRQFHPGFLLGPASVFFILFHIVYANAMCGGTSKFRAQPGIHGGPPLPLPTGFRVLQAPFFGNRQVFARRPFTKTERVYRGGIGREERDQGVDQIIVHGRRVQVSPFHRILHRGLQPIPSCLINGRRAAFKRRAADVNQFPSQDNAGIRRRRQLHSVLPRRLFRRRQEDLLRVVAPYVGRQIRYGDRPFIRMSSLQEPKELGQ